MIHATYTLTTTTKTTTVELSGRLADVGLAVALMTKGGAECHLVSVIEVDSKPAITDDGGLDTLASKGGGVRYR